MNQVQRIRLNYDHSWKIDLLDGQRWFVDSDYFPTPEKAVRFLRDTGVIE